MSAADVAEPDTLSTFIPCIHPRNLAPASPSTRDPLSCTARLRPAFKRRMLPGGEISREYRGLSAPQLQWRCWGTRNGMLWFWRGRCVWMWSSTGIQWTCYVDLILYIITQHRNNSERRTDEAAKCYSRNVSAEFNRRIITFLSLWDKTSQR